MTTPAEMLAILDKQRNAFLNEGVVSAEIRIDRIDRTIALLMDNQDALAEAMSADFGNRSKHQSRMADFYGTLEALKHAKKHLRSWMKDERRSAPFPLGLLGAKARIEYQPKGVVGNITTWNFPVFVALGPLAGIFAAGNRAMVKLSEVTPHSSELLKQLFARYFDESECVGITGGADVGAAFAELPLDHILFTGASSIGKHIMRAAAQNLTPVTLELGGKSPVIIGRSYDLQEAAQRIAQGKSLNLGQVCISPDYVFVPQEQLDAFVGHFEAIFKAMFPTILNNPDYTSVVNARHHARLQSYIADAREKGGTVRVINPANENFSQQQGVQRMPLHLVINPTEDMLVMQEELFGPILCLKSYQHVDETIAYINAHPRPLALYYFGQDKDEQRKVLSKTISGGVTLNDVMQHVGCEDLPFGGVGNSGMGVYHGFDGFKTFSHPKPIYQQTKFNMMKLGGMIPPYGKKMEDNLARMLKR